MLIKTKGVAIKIEGDIDIYFSDYKESVNLIGVNTRNLGEMFERYLQKCTTTIIDDGKPVNIVPESHP